MYVGERVGARVGDRPIGLGADQYCMRGVGGRSACTDPTSGYLHLELLRASPQVAAHATTNGPSLPPLSPSSPPPAHHREQV